MKQFNIVAILIAFLTMTVNAQVQNYRKNVSKRGTTVANFLEIGVGARALSMGGAFTALADDPSAIYWNVAGIAKMNKNMLYFSHAEWLADTKFDFIAGAFSLGRWGSLGLSLTALTMGEMEVTTVDAPEGTGQVFNAGSYAVSVAYAFKLTDRFAIGFNPKIIHEVIWDMSATGLAFDIGIHYKTPFKNVLLAFSMTNFGGKMSMNGENARVLYDFDPNSTGNNDRVTALLETDKWALPLNFRIGLLYKLMQSTMHRAVISMDAQHPNNDYESINFGFEYTYNQRYSIRAGYKNLFNNDSEESFTFGAGIKYPIVNSFSLSFDYAYLDFGLLNTVQQFSIGISF
jgi:opacity protein-like surface antigen